MHKSVAYIDERFPKYRIIREKTRPTYHQPVGGYGTKIPTDLIVQIEGDTRQRRVYCNIYSNCGSYYILIKDDMLFLRDCKNIEYEK